ncbi:MAG: hypothetical protein A2V77_24260 [Anaeromyxobacter sp. RBG_16_69_14]|nr:MAG: hypothetical protein A2V77_24260 [Anaeromyxobacter sp. RBG_16_69_14]
MAYNRNVTRKHAANHPKSSAAPVSVVTRFQVGRHDLRVSKVMEGRWAIAVDESALPNTFRTQADAWEAGVREADRIDKLAQG